MNALPAATGAGPPAAHGTGATRRRTGRWLALAAGALVAVLVAVLATRPPADVLDAQSPLLGRPAPTITGQGLDGRPVSLASMRGGFVLVGFLSSWCVPCQRELPGLVAWSRAHSDVRVVGVVFQDSGPAVRSMLGPVGADWPVVDDPRGTVALSYGVRQPPESYLIDPAGRVAAKFVGGIGSSQQDYIDSLVADYTGPGR
ncbi:MAG TPA: TlpA disulfide reductase family protein [Acidimicrobiales bacterium]|nr:TlpA disulfide reductase family protein [Acidimicrobiales bacterium]